MGILVLAIVARELAVLEPAFLTPGGAAGAVSVSACDAVVARGYPQIGAADGG